MDDDNGFLRVPHFLDALLLVVGWWTFLILSWAFALSVIESLARTTL